MRFFKLCFSALTYVFFLAVFNYLVIFLGGDFLKNALPLLSEFKTVDSGPAFFALPGLPPWLANISLLILFSIHHSVMARTGIKAIITRLIPVSSERSSFVLVTCIILSWLFTAWQPQTSVIWHFEGNIAFLLSVIFLMGAGLVLWSTFMISHWRLFGVTQAWNEFKGRSSEPDAFSTPALYKYSRHPMYFGILLVIWATPSMTAGHLSISLVWTLYVFVGIYFEERDLVRQFGHKYLNYQANVSKILPIKRRRKSDNTAPVSDVNCQLHID